MFLTADNNLQLQLFLGIWTSFVRRCLLCRQNNEKNVQASSHNVSFVPADWDTCS